MTSTAQSALQWQAAEETAKRITRNWDKPGEPGVQSPFSTVKLSVVSRPADWQISAPQYLLVSILLSAMPQSRNIFFHPGFAEKPCRSFGE